MNRKVRLFRLLAAASLGGCLSLLIVCINNCGEAFAYCVDVMEIILMIAVCIPGASFQTKGKAFFIYFTMMSVLSAGIHIAQSVCEKKGNASIWKRGVCAVLVISFFVSYLIMKKPKQSIYHVSICVKGLKIKTRALLDTGNSLRDPVTGTMVAIVEEDVVRPVLNVVKNDCFREISYHSVGEENGEIKIVDTDQIRLEQDGEETIIYGMYLGIYKGNLSTKGEFHMILHKDSLKEGKRNECSLSHLFTKTNKNISA